MSLTKKELFTYCPPPFAEGWNDLATQLAGRLVTEQEKQLFKKCLKYLDYDPITGIFKWKLTVSTNGVIGDKIETTNKCPYLKIQIQGEHYLAHRLAFLMCKGYLPEFIDHIDGDTKNNRIENLRGCTKSQNGMNRPKQINNKTGFKGVSWQKSAKKYTAQITVKGKKKYLGSFSCKYDAAKAYNKAALQYFGEFAYLNKLEGVL